MEGYMTFYHNGMRELQDRYEGRNVADRLEVHRMRTSFNGDDRALIETASFFFLATAAEDSVDCSFEGGAPGFISVTGPQEMTWPDYDGNRMYRSLGNILKNTRVGLLFLRFDGHRFDGSAARLRINGRARVIDEDASMTDWPGAKRLIRVAVDHIFPNCPRYIPKMDQVAPSVYVPREGCAPPEPDWKKRDFVKDIFDRERE
jgi:predicted pyridoxine 5'-phosphate oxidase superfamily flavin-nucleotide-binding protein